MAEKRIDINAKKVNGEVSSKEYKTSVSIKEIAAKINTASSQAQVNNSFKDIKNTVDTKELKSDVVKNKQYQTGKFDTKLKVTVTGLGEESIPNDSDFKRIFDEFSQNDSILLKPIKSIEDTLSAVDNILIIQEHVRVFNNLLEAIEIFSVNSFKQLSSDYLVTDNFTSVTNYKRSFESFISCTDDYCQICPDDDQTAVFTKVVKDINFVQETISRLFSTSKEDQVFNNDNLKFSYTKPFSNEFSFNDNSYRDISKLTLENKSAIDINNKDLSLLKTDIVNGSIELFRKDVSSTYNSQIQDSFDEIQKIDTSKRLLSEKESFVSDNVTRLWSANRNLSSTFSYNDVITKKDVSKSLLTFFSQVDTPAILSEKTLLTSNNSSLDLIDFSVEYFRILTDAVDATDDFNEVESDDDQTATFTKVLKDHGEYSELLTFDTSVVYQDNALLNDQPSFEVNTKLANEFNYEDTISILTQNVLNSEFSKDDLVTFEAGLNLLSIGSTISENLKFDLNYNISDLYIANEILIFNTFKPLSDNSVALEQLITDIFTSRKLEDENQTSDSGLINNQNYFAEAYVEPGYVGTNRTIT
jgi:hypothetical protein